MKSFCQSCVLCLILAVGGTSVAQSPECDVNHEKFVNGGVAKAKMSMPNNGNPCVFSFKFEGSFDPDEWKVLDPPKHGKLETGGSTVKYLPEPGYIGADEFVVEIYGRDPLKRRNASRKNGSFAFQVDVRGKP